MSFDIGTRRLQAYITQRTKVIPDDAVFYIPGGKYENQCLFCHNINAVIPVISNGEDTFTHMCDWCYDIVRKEMDVPRDRLQDSRRKQLLDSLSPGLEFVIPTGISRFFLHLNGAQKDYFAGLQNHCFICERLPHISPPYSTEDEEFNLIEIPVRQHRHIMGGQINICNDSFCISAVNTYRNRLRTLLEYNQYSKSIDKQICRCVACRKEYTIVGEEIEYRKNAETLEWQCSSCTYAMLNSWEKDKTLQKFYPGVIGEPRSELFIRHNTVTCYYCNELTTVDYMQSEFSMFLNNIYEEEFICKECSLLRKWFDMSTVCRVALSKLYIELHQSDFTFSLFRLTRGTLESLVINGNTDTSDPIDNLLVAFDEVTKIVKPDFSGLKSEPVVKRYNK